MSSLLVLFIVFGVVSKYLLLFLMNTFSWDSSKKNFLSNEQLDKETIEIPNTLNPCPWKPYGNPSFQSFWDIWHNLGYLSLKESDLHMFCSLGTPISSPFKLLVQDPRNSRFNEPYTCMYKIQFKYNTSFTLIYCIVFLIGF